MHFLYIRNILEGNLSWLEKKYHVIYICKYCKTTVMVLSRYTILSPFHSFRNYPKMGISWFSTARIARLNGKQYIPWSDGSYRSGLIRVYAVCPCFSARIFMVISVEHFDTWYWVYLYCQFYQVKIGTSCHRVCLYTSHLILDSGSHWSLL